MSLEHPTFEEKLLKHTETISRNGIGEHGMMFRQLMFGAILNNPNLADSYQTESAKFSGLIERVCPPDLVAGHIREVCESEFAPNVLSEDLPTEAFDKIIQGAHASQRGMTLAQRRQLIGGFYHTPEEVQDFCEFSVGNPEVLAASFYTSSILKDFVLRIADVVENKAVVEPLRRVAMHFGASNLLTRLPIALQQAVVSLHGSDASCAQIDESVVAEAMRILNESGQFQIKGKLMSPSGVKMYTFDCPVQGYLSRLFVGENALLPIIQKTVEITESPRYFHLGHLQNVTNISMVASLCSLALDGR